MVLFADLPYNQPQFTLTRQFRAMKLQLYKQCLYIIFLLYINYINRIVLNRMNLTTDLHRGKVNLAVARTLLQKGHIAHCSSNRGLSDKISDGHYCVE